MDDDALTSLIERCQAGETAAFEELFELHRERVYNLAYSLCADDALAQDIVQEVFVRLLTRIRQFRFSAAFTTWLYRVVVNAFYDAQRRRLLRLPDDSAQRWSAAQRWSNEPPQQRRLEEAERASGVRAAVTSLRPKLRAPIVLRYAAGLSYEEIAAVLQISPGTVASRLSRAHEALARRLRPLAENGR